MEAMEIMADHWHWFVSLDRALPVAEIVNRLQGAAGRAVGAESRFPAPTPWWRSYYAGTVWHGSEAGVRKCMESEKGK